MVNKNLIEKIKKAALKDEKSRKDIRYKRAMAFLTKKGFLKTNMNFESFYSARIRVADLIWAGQHVEPRILEVLPAAVARLPKVFIRDKKEKEINLQQVVKDLNEKKEVGHDFLNVPYKKIKVWMDISLNDKRTKIMADKKKMTTFRLNQQTILRMKELATQLGLSEAALIEKIIQNY